MSNVTTHAKPALDPRAQLTFASYSTGTWLEITFPVDAEPSALLADLAAIGWTEPDPTNRVPPYPAYDGFDIMKPLGYDEVDLHVAGPTGSALFGAWTTTEKRGHMLAARRVLRANGLTSVPTWRKTHFDMI